MKKSLILLFIFLSTAVFSANPQKSDLKITESDILIENKNQKSHVKNGDGIHLFIRKKGSIQSIMLIRYKNFPGAAKKILRAEEFNSVNGDEIFNIKGKSENAIMKTDYLLITSKTEENEFLGESFHIYIPKKVFYGIEPNVPLEDFSFKDLKIRTFKKKYCDKSGGYEDFSFESLGDISAEVTFSEISKKTDGELIHVENAKILPQKITSKIEELDKRKKICIVFAIDATESMKDDFTELKKNWLPRFEKQMQQFTDAKIGLLFYKDYGDEYNTNGLPVKKIGFVRNASEFSKEIKRVSVKGGGDKEEAVCEALYECFTGFEWESDAKKKVILIGDAGAHEDGLHDFPNSLDYILKGLRQKGVCVDCFLISNSSGDSDHMRTVEQSMISDELEQTINDFDAK